MKCPVCETWHENNEECPDLNVKRATITKYKEYLSAGPYMQRLLKSSIGKTGIVVDGPENDSYRIRIDNTTIWVPDCMLKFVE